MGLMAADPREERPGVGLQVLLDLLALRVALVAGLRIHEVSWLFK